MTKMNSHWGTTLDEFLDADGIREAAKAAAVRRLVAWQLTRKWNGRAAALADHQGDVGSETLGELE